MILSKINFETAKEKWNFIQTDDIKSLLPSSKKTQEWQELHPNGYFILDDAFITGQQMLPAKDNEICADYMCYNEKYIGEVQSYFDEKNIIHTGKTAFIMGGLDNNIGHFTFYDLPRLQFLEKISNQDDIVIVVSSAISKSSAELISLFVGHNRLLRLAPHEVLHSKTVIAATMPQCVVLEKTDRLPICPSFYEYFLKTLNSLALPPPPLKGENFYVSRRDASHRRILNEDRLVDLLADAGIIEIAAKNYSMAEQIALARQARHMIFPYGMNGTLSFFTKKSVNIQINPLKESSSMNIIPMFSLMHSPFIDIKINCNEKMDDDYSVDEKIIKALIKDIQSGRFLKIPPKYLPIEIKSS